MARAAVVYTWVSVARAPDLVNMAPLAFRPLRRAAWRVWIDTLAVMVEAAMDPKPRMPARIRERSVFAWTTARPPIAVPLGRLCVPVEVESELAWTAPYEVIDQLLSPTGIDAVYAMMAASGIAQSDAEEELPFLSSPRQSMSVDAAREALDASAPDVGRALLRAVEKDLTKYLQSAVPLAEYLQQGPTGIWEVLVPFESVICVGKPRA